MSHQLDTNIDIIIILDESGSMEKMGKEPIDSINSFIEEQQKVQNDTTRFTLVSFNKDHRTLVDSELLSKVKKLDYSSYKPSDMTSLNDAVCSTIDDKLGSSNPKNNILLIISDGEENSSTDYTSDELRERVKSVQSEHGWKVIFFGANIDTYKTGNSYNISKIAEYDQTIPGTLQTLCRGVSSSICDYRRNRSTGNINTDIHIPTNLAEINTPLLRRHNASYYNSIFDLNSPRQ